MQTVALLEGEVDQAVATVAGRVTIDLSDVSALDTAGAWLLGRLRRGLERAGSPVTWSGLSPTGERLLRAVDAARPEPAAPSAPAEAEVGAATRLFEAVGLWVVELGHDAVFGLSVLGGVTRGLGRAVVGRARFRFTSVVFHVDRAGLRAVPIIALMSFLIGAIIAQQGAFQLKYFGAELFTVDLVGILVLREIGVLLTAIMVAGRSGSAYTAEIGSMKMREEIDALTVLGLDPVEVLILPRIVALIIALPLLTFISDIAALAGGGVVSWLYIDISPEAFIARLRVAVALNTLHVGLIKAPFMALIIGIIAATEGMKVRGSVSSLGVRTTASVVNAIFMVIVVDGFFAIFLAAVRY